MADPMPRNRMTEPVPISNEPEAATGYTEPGERAAETVRKARTATADTVRKARNAGTDTMRKARIASEETVRRARTASEEMLEELRTRWEDLKTRTEQQTEAVRRSLGRELSEDAEYARIRARYYHENRPLETLGVVAGAAFAFGLVLGLWRR